MRSRENKPLPTKYEVLLEADGILADSSPSPRLESPEKLRKQRLLLEAMKFKDEAICEIRQLRVGTPFVLIAIRSENEIDRLYHSVKFIRYDYQGKILEVVAVQDENPKEEIIFSPLRPVIIRVK